MTLRELKDMGALEPRWDLDMAAAVMRSEEKDDSSMPRIGRVALGIGAWLAGFFLIGFVGVLLDFRNEETMGFFGLLLIVASVFLLRWKRSNPFAEQLALALGLAGHLMAFFGCHDLFSNDLMGPFVAALILAGPVYWFSNHSVQRFFSGFWVWLTWWGTSIGNWSMELNQPLFMLMLVASLSMILAILGGVPKLSGRTWRPALWSAVVGLGGGLFWLTQSFDERFRSVQVELIFGVAAAAGFVSVLWHLLRPAGRGTGSGGLIAVGILLAGLAMAGAPGVVVSLGLMLLAHARNERFLEAVAIVMLAGFLVAFYYHLGLPLNQKSITLMASGVVLLGLRWWFGRGEENPETLNA